MDDFPKLDECLLAWLGAGRWRVLGCRLRPLTLMHRELLRMLDSGLVTGRPVLLPELDVAVQICRRTPAQAAQWMMRPKRLWMGKLRMCWLLVCYGWRMKAQWQVLKDYLDSCENTPDMLVQVQDQTTAPAQRRDAPALLDMWSTLTAAGFDAEDLLQRWPSGLVRWLHETLRSKDGGRKFETEADRRLYEKARKMKEVTEPKLAPLEEMQSRIVRMMQRMRR